MGFNFLSTPRILCQAGGLSDLGGLARGLGMSRAFLITDPGIVACGFAAQAVAALTDQGVDVAVFDKVQADPPIAVVEAAVGAARAFGADGVIGLGGGSSLDTAKVTAAAAAWRSSAPSPIAGAARSL